MYVLELRFEDTPTRLDERAAHRKRIQELHGRGILLAAGPWADDTGALLIFNGDREMVDRIISEDPYYRTAGVEITALREWRPLVV